MRISDWSSDVCSSDLLTNHIVVLGYGISGAEAVRELIARGTDPACIVVIDPARNRVNAAEAAGCNVMAGEESSDEILPAVRTAEAQRSEERRVGKVGCRWCRYRWLPCV